MSDNEDIERVLPERLKADDPAAIGQLYDHLGGRLYGYLVSLTSSRSDAEELLSELFFGVVKKRHWVAQAENVRVYLFAMARNLAHEMHRKRQRRQEHHEAYTDYLELRDDPSGPWSRTEARHLQESFAVLSPEQREVVILRIYEDLTFAEIAEVLRISQNTVASRYRYALAKLREQLKEEPHDA